MFKVERQGDPLSLYLFITALELLMKIRNYPCIKGNRIGNAEVKLAPFAVGFLHDKGSGLEHLFSRKHLKVVPA